LNIAAKSYTCRVEINGRQLAH